MLHLNGEGTQFQEYGYRPWMKTGITLTGNRDLSYFGLRKLSTNVAEQDKTETVFLWSDNISPIDGPDKLVFRFSGFGGNDGASVSSNRLSSTDLDALHVAQFTGTGLMGLGNTFGTNATGMAAAQYIDPKSLLHMSYDWRSGGLLESYGFAQITYRRPNTAGADIIGQGETENDGLRFGIDNDVFGLPAKPHLNSYLRWQEASSFIIQTEDNLIPNIAANERIRVTSIGALTLNYLPTSYIGLTGPSQVSRISISHNGSNALSKPMSLLHLGYNIGSTFASVPLLNGWRPWMDLGMLVSNSTDNVYIGLKPRNGTATASNNEMDAVISWGNDGENLGSPGPDVMRFIFTTEPLFVADSSAARSQDGLEIMRLYPGKDEYYSNGDSITGRVGIGDFTFQGVNEQPTHKLDVVGNGRFRFLPDSLYMADSTVNKIVMVDSLGVLRWTTSLPQGFGVCADTVNGILSDNSKVDLNDFNFYFEGQGAPNTNHVSIGEPCGNYLAGKLTVSETDGYGIGILTFVTSGGNNLGGVFRVVGGATNTGVVGTAAGGTQAIGGSFTGSGGSVFNYGVRGVASGFGGGTAYGVFGQATPLGAPNYAGYFDGDVFANGIYAGSDQILKTNIQDLTDAMNIISQLEPKTFEYDLASFPSMNLQSGNQHGLIAQDVQNVLPDLVSNMVHPAQYDSLGNEIYPSVSFLGLEYTELIPIMIKGMQEQQAQLDSVTNYSDSLEQVVTDLNDRLTLLENCLSNILPALCQANQMVIESTPEEVQEKMNSIIDVNLSDRNSIVLNQNVPNPFAERTVITYSIPETVIKAQIHFYNGVGALINSVDIVERGNGELNVYANDLSSGVYTYSLVADGKIIATKRMVKH